MNETLKNHNMCLGRCSYGNRQRYKACKNKKTCWKEAQILRKCFKAMKKPKKSRSYTINRLHTMTYSCLKDDLKEIEINQPKFTTIDRQKKEEIFGYSGKKSFISGNICKGIGDHIYGIREGLHDGHDWVGSNTQWNIVPLTQSENKNYKRVTIDNRIINLAYDILTEEDIKKLPEDKKVIYNKLKSWKSYVNSRGAKMYWENMRERDLVNTKIVSENLMVMDNQRRNTLQKFISQGII